jgi:hypothetical protein
MADLEQDVFDAGAAEAPAPDIAPSPQPTSSPPSQDNRAISDAIDAIRGPVPNYGTQPQSRPQPQQQAPNPDDEPVKAGVLRQLLEERTQRQRYEAQIREFQAREQERARQQAQPAQPKAEDLIFQDPAAYDRMIEQKIEAKTAHIRLESDMQMAAMRHGQLFDYAWQHFHQTCQNGQDPVAWFRVMNARSPGEEMVRWFNERRLLHESGGDVNAFRMKVAQQLLQDPEFLAYMQTNAGQVQQGEQPQPQHAGQTQPRGEDGRFVPQQQQQPRHEVRLPTSLGRMNGAGRGTSAYAPEDGSEEAIFDAGRPRAR